MTADSGSDTRAALLEACGPIFAEKGLEGATVKDIADAAGVNIALISYHFGGKEGLYRTLLEAMGNERLAAAERMLAPASTPEEFRLRLKLFAEEFLHCHRCSPHISRIIHRDFDGRHPIALDVFKGIFLNMFTKVRAFFATAKEAGILRADFDPDASTPMIFGAIVHSLRMDFLRQELLGTGLSDPAFAAHFIDQLVKNFCDGSFPRSPS